MLEGSDEGFFLNDREEGFLSVRQLSLLSGMTEASIRTLSSRSRKDKLSDRKSSDHWLIATNDGKNTSIDIANAKAWLKSKGRYVEITKTSQSGADDFTTRKFSTQIEFEREIENRYQYLCNRSGAEIVDVRIKASGVSYFDVPATPKSPITLSVLGEEQLLNVALMQSLAVALELPPVMFALRASEVVTQDRLRAIEKQLKQAQQTN